MVILCLLAAEFLNEVSASGSYLDQEHAPFGDVASTVDQAVDGALEALPIAHGNALIQGIRLAIVHPRWGEPVVLLGFDAQATR